MSKTLKDIAQQLKDTDKKVQLIYAFNGTGKTQLSREFKTLVDSVVDEAQEYYQSKVLYYNAFTEDLFYWNNDLVDGVNHRLQIRANAYTKTAFETLGLDQAVVTTFQHYTSERLTPRFNMDFTEVTFSIDRGDDDRVDNLKISKGEESNFIWSVFYTLLDQITSSLNISELEYRETDEFDRLEYVFIDDPVSSLDENHLIKLAVGLAGLIRSSQSELKFVVTTHNPLFYNVLHNELGLSKKGRKEGCYLLEHNEDGAYDLSVKYGDSNKSFSYHLYVKQTLEEAIAENQIERYHFTLLRNLYEKTANFLGYPNWSELLPEDKNVYAKRVMNFYSHSSLSDQGVAEPTPQEKETVKFLLKNLLDNYSYWQQEQEAQNA